MIRDADSGCCGGRLFVIAICDWCGAQQQIPKTEAAAVEVLREQWNWVRIETTHYHFHSRKCRSDFEKNGHR